MQHPYFRNNVLIATMHKKEDAIKSVFEERVGCKIIVPENFDTDIFGTFSGEVERKYTAYETLRLKAIKAAELFGYDYVISSEGSFGPHPNFLLTVNTEMLLFYDKLSQLFIVEYEIAINTNFSQFTVDKINFKSSEYYLWLNKVMFPSHGLILRVNNNEIYKGIKSEILLDDKINFLLEKNETLLLETDMRAMMNPTRMSVIKSLADKLSTRVSSLCEHCGSPGFGEIKYSGNLQCALCSHRTKIPKYKNLCCIKCEYKISELISSNKEFSDPTYCNFCNP